MAGTVEQEAAIWKKLHATREEHIEQARRARDYQTALNTLIDKKSEMVAEATVALLKQIFSEVE